MWGSCRRRRVLHLLRAMVCCCCFQIHCASTESVPLEPFILDHNRNVMQDVIGPYDEGAHLSLICEVDAGNLQPTVTWWRGSTLLDASFTATPQGIRNELVLNRLKRSDLMSVITCQVSGANLTTPRSKSVTLDMKLKPLDVRITTLQRPLSAGRKATLICQTTGSRPPAELSWWKGSKRIPSSKEAISSDGKLSISTLTFVPTVEDNGKRLMCRSCNRFLPNGALEDSWILNIYYIPRLQLVLGAKIPHRAIREQDDVYFECNIQANPWVTEVGWRFEGSPLYSNPSVGVIVRNQSLLLQNVKKEQKGLYQCIAANVEGEGESEPVFLKIQYAPICKHTRQSVYGAALQEKVFVTCEVDADPTEVTFQWMFNSTERSIRVKSFKSNHTISVAAFTVKSKLDYGYLVCQGSNTVRGQKEPCLFRIVSAGPPEPMKSCRVANESVTSIVIECEPGEDGGLPQQFHLEIFNSASESLQQNLTETEQPVFTATDLPMGTIYLLVLYATNARGRSNSVALTVKTLNPADSHADKREARRAVISPVLGVLIGIVSSLVLAAVLVVVRIREDGCEADEKLYESALQSPGYEVKSVYSGSNNH